MELISITPGLLLYRQSEDTVLSVEINENGIELEKACGNTDRDLIHLSSRDGENYHAVQYAGMSECKKEKIRPRHRWFWINWLSEMLSVTQFYVGSEQIKKVLQKVYNFRTN